MPETCRFLGISIPMYHREHGPPHSHARCGDYRVTVNLESGIVEGRFPRPAPRHVLEWYEIHRQELDEDWTLAVSHKALKRIKPLG